jgi:hypothetical protein
MNRYVEMGGKKVGREENKTSLYHSSFYLKPSLTYSWSSLNKISFTVDTVPRIFN